MGRRSEPRMQVQLPVRIFGTDVAGAVFTEKVFTVSVSRNGVELGGVRAKLAHDEIVGLTYANNRAHFRVKWVGEAGSAKAGHLGLLNIAPEKPLWDFPPPAPALDAYQPGVVEHRGQPRFRCQNSVEIHIESGASFWGTLADLSLGGCYVEMPIPLEPGTRLKVGIWIDQAKAWANGEVAHRTPGLGVGIRFKRVAEQDMELIRGFLGKLSPFAKKR